MSPIYRRKTPIFLQKSPVYPHTTRESCASALCSRTHTHEHSYHVHTHMSTAYPQRSPNFPQKSHAHSLSAKRPRVFTLHRALWWQIVIHLAREGSFARAHTHITGDRSRCALYIYKRALFVRQKSPILRAHSSTKEPYLSAKRALFVRQKSPLLRAHSHTLLAIEEDAPYVSTKEPYALAKRALSPRKRALCIHCLFTYQTPSTHH